MKYQINEYLNPLFIKASTDFMTESEKAKQQERQRETESEKAEQRERQRARVEWDDSCGRDSAFKKQWDSEVPNEEYFKELFRVSKNQIIWGGNYFNLPPNRGFIIWDRMVYIPTMSQIEVPPI